MNYIERFSELLCGCTVEDWRKQLFKLAHVLGYERTLLAIFPDRHAPVEAEFAFLHSNYSSNWRNKYDAEKMGHVDPTVIHCATKLTPLIWTPETFSALKQKQMYEEACGHGLRAGVTLPIHGPRGEFGILCFVRDSKPDKIFRRDTLRSLPALSCFRDFIFESSLQFIKHSCAMDEHIHVTRRELECLKWGAMGKSSWEIGYLLNCSEATVNFHFGNIRRKFNTNSRQQAVIKAINLGLIHPA